MKFAFKVALVFAAIIAAVFYLDSGNAKPLTDPEVAMAQSEESDKILFISVGSKDCVICKRMKQAIKDGSAELDRDKFVWADLDYYQPKEIAWFRSKYNVKVEAFPTLLTVGRGGKVLTYKVGVSSAEDLNMFLRKAQINQNKLIREGA